MNWRSTLAVPVVCTAALLALTACKVDTTTGSAPAHGASPTTDAAVPATHKSTTGSSTSKRTPTSDPGDGQAPDCTTAQLKITMDEAEGASGRSVAAVHFRNTGAACRISGYPMVSARRTDGTKVAFEQSPAGFAGGQTDGRGTPPEITLKAGQTASALIDASNFNPKTNGSCGEVTKMQVGPPAGGQPVTVSWSGGCADFGVHPLILGTSGRQD
jgi:hypothetical protein